MNGHKGKLDNILHRPESSDWVAVVCYLSCLHAHSSALSPLHSFPLDPLALLSVSRTSPPSVSAPVSESESDTNSVSVSFVVNV